MSCDHPLDAEFLHRSDVAVLDLLDEDGRLVVEFALPCPECGQSLGVRTPVESTREIDVELPLEDVEEQYD